MRVQPTSWTMTKLGSPPAFLLAIRVFLAWSQVLHKKFDRSNSGRRDAAVHFCSALRTATAATPTFGDYTSPPPGFREPPPEPEKSWSYTEYTPVLIYAFAAMALFLTVFLRGSHQVFCLGLVNGAVFAACCCLRGAPRKQSYHLSQP